MIWQLRALRDRTALPELFGFAGTPASEQGQPVPGLTVTAESEEHRDYRTQTADDGSWVFRDLPAGRYQLRVQAPAGRLAQWGYTSLDRASANVRPGNTCPAEDIVVYYDGRVSGTVARRDGQPLSGVVFVSYDRPEKLNASPRFSRVSDGHFEIARLRPGRYRLFFKAQGVSITRVIYYPGTQVASDAILIEIGEGTHRDDLQFTID